jgi:hypothetical protein
MALLPFNPSSLLRTPSFLEDDDEERFNRARPVGPPLRGPATLPIPGSTTPKLTAPPMLPPPQPIKPMESTGDRSQVPIPSLSGRGAPTPYSPVAAAKYDYVTEGRGEDGSYKRGFGDIAKSALAGLGQGFATGGGLGAGLGGALAGGVGSAINPRMGREFVFDSIMAPRMEADLARQQQQQAAQQAQAKAARDAEFQDAQRRKIEAETDKLRLPPPAPTPRAPVRSDRGLLDLETRQIIPGTEPLPPAPKEPTAVWRQDARGNWVNLNDPANKGKTIQGPRVRGMGGSGSGKQDAATTYQNLQRALQDAQDAGDADLEYAIEDQMRRLAVGLAGKGRQLPAPALPAPSGTPAPAGTPAPLTEQQRIDRAAQANPKQKTAYDAPVGPMLGASPDRIRAYAQRFGISEEQARRELSGR